MNHWKKIQDLVWDFLPYILWVSTAMGIVYAIRGDFHHG